MASVWVARLQGKHGFEKLVAIKTILPRFASDMRFQHMFLDEARIASRIEHTNVAQILDLGEENGVLYIVMEWVDGDSLSKLHRVVDDKGMKVPQGVALRILADTCGGLHAAHDLRGSDGALLGVVHRDVSPQNVLVSTRGVAKLIDFGIAKARDRVVGDTNTGALKGKIQYMAPEQATGANVDRRADIWAIGAMAYHLLAGRAPFEGPNQLATLHQLTLGRPPTPIPNVHASVQALVRRALTHDPSKRFATALDMQVAIEKAMVEAKVATTIGDVAAFCDEHLGERALSRKTTVDGSLKAAQQRARAALASGEPHESASGLTPPPVSGREALLTMPAVPGAPRKRSPSASDADLAAPISESSSATLGSAGALATPVAPTSGTRRAVVVGGVVGVLTIAIVGAIATFVLRGSHEARVDVASQPAAASAPAPKADLPPPTPEPQPTAAADPTPDPEPSASATAAAPPKHGGRLVPVIAPKAQPTTKPTTTAAPPPKRKADLDGF